ncbi:hypothetical protein [Burkholderia cenocepacia]|uniref:hypothetical protein n=1 Tax=Burkholderia cenocepacia TaxID=95486 RepID=UPI002AB1A65A|nr:hypothetical protein [Burkholderia cenocepacia]
MTLDNLTSPTWWLTAVAGAIVLKIVSDYARQGLEKLLGKFFKAWTQRSKAAKERFDRTVDRLATDDDMRIRYFQRETRFMLLSILSSVLGVFALGCWITIITLKGQSADAHPGATDHWKVVLVYVAYALVSGGAMINSVAAFMKSYALARMQLAAEMIKLERSIAAQQGS